MIGVWIVWLWGTLAFGAELSPHLDPATWAVLKAQLTDSLPTHDLAAQERSYQNAAQQQSLRDALQVYDPANRPKVQVALTSFHPQDGRRGGWDLGYGLRVIKRLDLGEKTIELKEFWPMDRQTGGLFRPDEIRIKTRVEPGPRNVAGAEHHFLYDRVYLAWGPGPSEVTIHRRTLYDETNRVRNLRSPVSAPYSCLNCHQASSGLRRDFGAPGATLNPESIVQGSFYQTPREKMRGLQKYLGYLQKHFPTQTDLAATSLSDDRHLWPDGIAAQLKERVRLGTSSWLGDDKPVPPADATADLLDRQGYYLDKYQETLWLDALELVFEGKYRWWDPRTLDFHRRR